MLTGVEGVFALLAELLRLTGHLVAAPQGLPALAVTVLAGAVLAAALTVCLASVLGSPRATVLMNRTAALREKSWRAAFLPQRDPDAAGRPRPRAPSAAPAAAVH